MSLPSWECGLKYLIYANLILQLHVTPFVGVWIEIYQTKQPKLSADVTPFVGVWIEIERGEQMEYSRWVTPFVGVWIEI